MRSFVSACDSERTTDLATDGLGNDFGKLVSTRSRSESVVIMESVDFMAGSGAWSMDGALGALQRAPCSLDL